jgi:ketosteroid isomerase-like protein
MTDADEIRATLARFCQLIDDRRLDEWGELFTADVVYGRADGTVLRGRDDVRDTIARGYPDGWMKHMIVNSLVEVAGDEARVSSDCMVLGPTADGPPVVRSLSRMVQRLVRSDRGWLIAEHGQTAIGRPR